MWQAASLHAQQITLKLGEPLFIAPKVQLDRRDLINDRCQGTFRTQVDDFEVGAARGTGLDPHMRHAVGHVIVQALCFILPAVDTD